MLSKCIKHRFFVSLGNIKATGCAHPIYILIIYIYIYINVGKSCQRMNLRDVGSETSVNDTVQTSKNDK
jgi:hypothetical protein